MPPEGRAAMVRGQGPDRTGTRQEGPSLEIRGGAALGMGQSLPLLGSPCPSWGSPAKGAQDPGRRAFEPRFRPQHTRRPRCAGQHCPAPPGPGLTFALVVELAGLLRALHLDRQVSVHTGDLGHGLRLQQDNAIVTLASRHRAVLQRPGLIHLRAAGTARPPATASGAQPRVPASLPTGRPLVGSPRGWGPPHGSQRQPRAQDSRQGGEEGHAPGGEGPQGHSQELERSGAPRSPSRAPGARRWGRLRGSGRARSAGCRWRRSGSRPRRSCCRRHPLGGGGNRGRSDTPVSQCGLHSTCHWAGHKPRNGVPGGLSSGGDGAPHTW